ncbi:MAG: ParA family protein [Syntrophobacter sp.]
MYTVTFYSYKGGVGRTLALANVAYTLATEGNKARVVVVDFDLEAPGLDLIAPFTSAGAPPRGGVVEYISEYANSPKPDPEKLPSLLPYSCEVEGLRNLAFIPAGKKDGNYQQCLTCLNWEKFYRRQQGYLFFEHFKNKIEEEFSPDYLLVDSRTGLADVAGITTHQMADLVVLVFGLNRQNLNGIKGCYQSIV